MKSIHRSTPLVIALAAALQLTMTGCASSPPPAYSAAGSSDAQVQGTALPQTDQQFLAVAGEFSAKSIELARMAKGSASDAGLRGFAGYLETQHENIARAIDGVSGGVRAFAPPSTVPGGQHGASTHGDDTPRTTPTISNDPDMARLVTLSGPAFDRAWVRVMIDRHPEVILAYRNAEQYGQAEVQGVAARELVVIRRHLKQLETYDKRLPIIAGQ